MQLRRIVRGPTALIIALLAVQLLVPLGYYTVRRDRSDDRFAWRMFSAEPAPRCRARFLVGEERRPVRLEQTFDEAWRALARRGRVLVVERMARHLCTRHPGQAVRVDLICRQGDGELEPISGDWDVCLTGTVR